MISGISATWISKKIVNPLNSINLDKPQDSDVYEELKPFTKRIAEENFEKAQREEIRAQYTANVSHELKTPLTSISGFAEILMQGGTDPKITMDFSKSIYDEAQRMTTLVNDIIKLSKLDEKSIAMEKEALSLRTICSEVMEVLSASAKTKNLYAGARIVKAEFAADLLVAVLDDRERGKESGEEKRHPSEHLLGVVAAIEPQLVHAVEEFLELSLRERTPGRRAALADIEPQVPHHRLVPGEVGLGDHQFDMADGIRHDRLRRREVI